MWFENLFMLNQTQVIAMAAVKAVIEGKDKKKPNA
jgi:hypothetical protein